VASLSGWFKDAKHLSRHNAVVTIIGSGGKTSLIWHLTASLSDDRKILVTTTTKMLVPSPDTKHYDRYYGLGGLPPDPAPGVTLAGLFNRDKGKLESFPPEKLENLASGYDLVLIEGDGAKGHPYKAWARHEPIVPPFTNLTIGVLPMRQLGEPISEKLIHRLSLFLSLTDTSAGELLKREHILKLITGKPARVGESPLPGLFARACGKKLLFFNQVEDKTSLNHARKLAESLPAGIRGGLCGIIAGSVREDWVVEL